MERRLGASNSCKSYLSDELCTYPNNKNLDINKLRDTETPHNIRNHGIK